MERLGNPSPVWEKGRDEGLPCPYEAERRRLVRTNTRTPSPLPLSHPGEGFPALYRL